MRYDTTSSLTFLIPHEEHEQQTITKGLGVSWNDFFFCAFLISICLLSTGGESQQEQSKLKLKTD